MPYKTTSEIVFTLVFLALLAACSKSDSGSSANSPTPQGLTCSLNGSWSRCDADGVNSSKVNLTFAGGTLSETIDNFNGDTSCGGTSAGQFTFNAAVTLGIIGHSAAAAGGTDVDLVPDVDFAGCGAGATVYTMIKFSDDCSQFQAANVMPACSDTGRGTGFDPSPFIKQ